MPEFWLPMGAIRPTAMSARARQAEADGWDGMKIFDSQCLYAECFVMATTAVLATTRLQLSLSTSNPATRHPSVAASAMAALAELAGPRVWYGVGRGDSALAWVGGAPAGVGMFERYVAAVRAYLHGEPVALDAIREWRLTADVATGQMAHAPERSRLRWPDPAAPPPRIEVYATGPKVLGVGGRLGDRVALGLGGHLDRLKWAIQTAREARERAGLDPATLSFSAIVPVGVDEDMAQARRMVANIVASSGRFSILGGKVAGPATEAQRQVWAALGATYDMNHHGGHGVQLAVLTDEFIDSYAIVGPPQRCAERIAEIAELGVEALMLAPPQGDVGEDVIRTGYERLTHEVLPLARAASD